MLRQFKGRKLYRSPKDAIVFGICAGLGDYLQVDPVFVRLIVLALAFLTHGWPVLLAYTIGVFLIPIDPKQDAVPSRQEPKDVTPPPPAGTASTKGKMDADQNM